VGSFRLRELEGISMKGMPCKGINKRTLTEAIIALAKTQDSHTEGRLKSVFHVYIYI
jgi:hypothetical protein